MTVRKFTVGALATLAVFVSLGAAYLKLRAPPGDRGVSDRIAAAVSRGPGTVIELARLTPLSWTDVYVFPPFTTRARAERAMNIRWRYRWSAVEYRDHLTFVVLLDSGRVVSAFEHPIKHGDMTGVAHAPGHWTRQRARFQVQERGKLATGAPYYLLEALPD